MINTRGGELVGTARSGSAGRNAKPSSSTRLASSFRTWARRTKAVEDCFDAESMVFMAVFIRVQGSRCLKPTFWY